MPVSRKELNIDNQAFLLEMLQAAAPEFASRIVLIDGENLNHSVLGDITTHQMVYDVLREKLESHLGIDVSLLTKKDINGTCRELYSKFKVWKNQQFNK